MNCEGEMRACIERVECRANCIVLSWLLELLLSVSVIFFHSIYLGKCYFWQFFITKWFLQTEMLDSSTFKRFMATVENILENLEDMDFTTLGNCQPFTSKYWQHFCVRRHFHSMLSGFLVSSHVQNQIISDAVIWNRNQKCWKYPQTMQHPGKEEKVMFRVRSSWFQPLISFPKLKTQYWAFVQFKYWFCVQMSKIEKMKADCYNRTKLKWKSSGPVTNSRMVLV